MNILWVSEQPGMAYVELADGTVKFETFAGRRIFKRLHRVKLDGLEPGAIVRYRVGGVCGGLSKFGSHGAQSHGVRSFTVGQPGHCAYLVWNEKDGYWSDAYFVTGKTGPHFSLADGHIRGAGLASLEEQDRYYSNPKRMGAEYLRWAGKLEESMRYAPGNWQAANEWRKQLVEKNAPKAEWDKFASAVR